MPTAKTRPAPRRKPLPEESDTNPNRGAMSPTADSAATGVEGGPTGIAAAAIVGAVQGAEGVGVNPAAEHDYWREHFRERPYVCEAEPIYERYAPAYQFGWESYYRRERSAEGGSCSFEEAAKQLAAEWESSPVSRDLSWTAAEPAARDAWERVAKRCS